MIREISIENYKSIDKLKIELGRVTVFIGENGCGKTNILEGIALGSAAANDKLDNEFLTSRGMRVTEPEFMRSAFEQTNITKNIQVSFTFAPGEVIKCNLQHPNQPYSSWENLYKLEKKRQILKLVKSIPQDKLNYSNETIIDIINNFIEVNTNSENRDLLKKFLIFSPENSSLRIFDKEGQIQPLGIKGEGLFKLLTVLNKTEKQEKLQRIKEEMRLIDWFENFDIPENLLPGERAIKIKDRYISPELNYFNQNSSNEGFLFLLFYFCLFISDDTPNFFSVDNIDASLNPRLCRRLIEELVHLAKNNSKQVIFTTHNPAILDGLDLNDDEQRIFVIYRNKLGHTKARRIFSPQPLEGQKPVRLSEAFLRGYIGGLPKNF